jgi:ABC-type glycerol-3-phosphate transport system permease component
MIAEGGGDFNVVVESVVTVLVVVASVMIGSSAAWAVATRANRIRICFFMYNSS